MIGEGDAVEVVEVVSDVCSVADLGLDKDVGPSAQVWLLGAGASPLPSRRFDDCAKPATSPREHRGRKVDHDSGLGGGEADWGREAADC